MWDRPVVCAAKLHVLACCLHVRQVQMGIVHTAVFEGCPRGRAAPQPPEQGGCLQSSQYGQPLAGSAVVKEQIRIRYEICFR